MQYKTIEQTIGNTPLVKLQRLNPNKSNTILLKLEGNNPAGSVKDRTALNMITQAEGRGEISTGDTLIEATSGNTGIALAMVAAIKGYKMILIMPENLSQERRDAMAAYGAELILVSEAAGMEGARDLADTMEKDGKGKQLDQFSNRDNSGAHINTTAQEIWQDTNGEVTHFVSAMGTTGTIMGVSETLKKHNKTIQIIGVQPEDGAKIAGIRRWPTQYL
jgi:cysteine synthase B